MLFLGNEEQRLIKRLQDGDKAAAHDFYSRYADYLAAVCSRYVVDADDFKDVFQDAFIQILTNIGNFRYNGSGSLQAWAKKVVVNQALKFLREKHRHALVQLDCDVSDEAEDDDPLVSDIPPDVIHQMVSDLPTGYRTVLNLYVFEGKSHQQIANLLGIKENSSASQLHRAKNLLAKMIRQYINKKTPRQ